MTSQEAPATFHERVNLVMVPVVVRDRQGRSVGNLKREDFRLLDQGKPQVISRFSVEKRGDRQPRKEEAAEGIEKLAGENKTTTIMPERYVAYLFDDVHLRFSDMVQARDAAAKHLSASLQPTDRAAIFSTSGQTVLDFTDDRAQLQESLLRLRPRPIARSPIQGCPDLSYYISDLIANKNEDEVLAAAIQETIVCAQLQGPMAAREAEAIVKSEARRVVESAGAEARMALIVLRDAVRRIAAMPGQRTIVLVSPGFFTGDYRFDEIEILDRAIRSSVTINTLDARGLYVGSIADASVKSPGTIQYSILKSRYDAQAEAMEADVLAELADGTGGTFFHWNNDLAAGFNRLAGAPEFTYVLGFSPQNLKVDGKYHGLKVTLKESPKLAVTARRGYFAPQQAQDQAETARREIEEALFSRDEMQELLTELHTQFFKSSDESARLTVLVRMDLRQLKYRKLNGRNLNNLTIVAGLFDRNGNYLKANRTLVDMRLLDETLQTKLHGPITLKSAFDVHPGAYFIRLVVRDVEGQMMSAKNGAVEIP